MMNSNKKHLCKTSYADACGLLLAVFYIAALIQVLTGSISSPAAGGGVGGFLNRIINHHSLFAPYIHQVFKEDDGAMGTVILIIPILLSVVLVSICFSWAVKKGKTAFAAFSGTAALLLSGLQLMMPEEKNFMVLVFISAAGLLILILSSDNRNIRTSIRLILLGFGITILCAIMYLASGIGETPNQLLTISPNSMFLASTYTRPILV